MLILTVLFTGCGKSEEEKKMEREDREERLETEAMMRMWGFDDETIEEEMELMEEEQKETRKERIEEEKQEEIERLKREEEAKKEEARLEASRCILSEELECNKPCLIGVSPKEIIELVAKGESKQVLTQENISKHFGIKVDIVDNWIKIIQ